MKDAQTKLERFNRLLNGNDRIKIKTEGTYQPSPFDELVDAGLIGCKFTGFGQYYYPLNALQSTPRTISFRFPDDLRTVTLKDVGGGARASNENFKAVVSNYMLFINDWILNGKEVAKAEELPTDIKKQLLVYMYHYMRTEGVISVPQFMFEGFLRELKGLNTAVLDNGNSKLSALAIKISILDNDPKLVSCPKCKHQIILRRNEKIVKCDCGCKFST